MPTVYLERKLTLRVAQDSNFLKKHFELKELTENNSTLTHSSDFRRDLGASATVNLDLGGITTVRVLFVETDGTVTVRLNGTEEITVAPLSSTSTGVLYLEGTFTSISLINPSSTAAVTEINWLIAGV